MSRRRVLGLVGAATAAALVGLPDVTNAARAFQTGYGVAIEPRSTWAGDNRPVRGDLSGETVKFLLVHHTAGPSQGDPIELIHQVYDFHTGSQKGWPDVAYNFFIEPGGRVFEARAGSLQNAVMASATGGNQGFSQLVCLLGDFTSRNPTDQQLLSLNQTLAWLADRYGLDTSQGTTARFTSRGSNKWSEGSEVTAAIISGHREMSATACPGDTFFPYLKDRVQSEVHALRGNPQAQATVPTTEDTGSVDPEPSLEPVDAVTTSRATATVETAPSSTGAPVTTTPQPSTSITLPARTTVPTTTSVPPSTVAATVAEGPVNTPPAPRGDEFAIDAPQPAQTDMGQSSSNATALALGAGAAAMVVAAAAYVAVRGRNDDADWATPSGDPLPPPPGGGDPLK